MDLDRNSLTLGARPALLLVDLINGFTDPECPLGSEADDVVAANQKLLTAFRERLLPVIFTTVVFRDSQQGRTFRNRVPPLELLTPDSDWIKIDPALGRRPEEPVIEKRGASAFFGTRLRDLLETEGVDSLVVTGLTTSGCVRASVVDGLQHDYAVFVPREAVGDRNPDAHASNLFDMHAKYADVVSLDELVGMLP